MYNTIVIPRLAGVRGGGIGERDHCGWKVAATARCKRRTMRKQRQRSAQATHPERCIRN